jgi:predicted nucleotidyltransferase
MSFPSSPTLTLPEKEIAYLRALTDTIQTTLDSCLKAVYLFGSASYGEYQPGTSDLDLSIVITSQLPIARYQSLASVISHAALPCPARKLEFVLYTYETVNDLTRFPKFEMNFNTGMGMDDHLVFDPSNEAGHWFLLDLAAGRQLGVPLLGPAPQEVIGEIKQEWVVDALSEGLEWWCENASASPDAALNACRAWRWIETGLWGSKLDGAKWVLEQREEPDIISTVNHAVELRSSRGALDVAEALRMIDIVRPIFLKRHAAKGTLSMHGSE